MQAECKKFWDLFIESMGALIEYQKGEYTLKSGIKSVCCRFVATQRKQMKHVTKWLVASNVQVHKSLKKRARHVHLSAYDGFYIRA